MPQRAQAQPVNIAITPPGHLDLRHDNLSVHFDEWKESIELYLKASGISKQDNETKSAIILHTAGTDVIKLSRQFKFNDQEDPDDPQVLMSKVEEYCKSQVNEVMQTFRFNQLTLRADQSFDSFLDELHSRAKSCNFTDAERMVRDKIVFSVKGQLQQALLREKNLTLDKCISICRAAEATNQHLLEMAPTTSHIDKVTKPPSARKYDKRPVKRFGNLNAYISDCKFCGKDHKRGKSHCPAYGKTCSKCHGKNHFQVKCRSINYCSKQSKEAVSDDQSPSDDDVYLNNIAHLSDRGITALLQVNGCKVGFQLDTGADVNIICQRYVKKEQVQPSFQKLTMWNHSTLQPVGEAMLTLHNPKSNLSENVKFVVVKNRFNCLLGLDTILKMNLLTVNDNAFLANIEAQPELGDLGCVSLHVDSNVQPRILPCRNIPLSLRDKVKAEIDKLVKLNVLEQITEPTKWVNQMAVVKKKNGDLRICIDPQPLNCALSREHYRLPVIDDVLPFLSKAKWFTKLDVKHAYWHVSLDAESSKLTTMITPFGRFCWKRLPFGLKVSSEIFQKRLNEALCDFPNVFTVADDIVVIGSDESDHDKNLQALYERCNSKHIILNDQKSAVKQTSITFMGHKITSNGVEADPAKMSAIVNMPEPHDVASIRRFCGMTQYLYRFLPSLSEVLAPLHNLTRKGVDWHWSDDCKNAVRIVKEKITSAPILAYYDVRKPLTLQVDSSKNGVGAVLLQEGKPVEYASRALTNTERNWSQIEKEMLAVVFGLEHFNQYTYARHVIVHNDHKPIQMILQKSLCQAPKRLQSLIMRIYAYDISFAYVPGSDLKIADTLSRAFCDAPVYDAKCRVFLVNDANDIPDTQLEDIKRAMSHDNEADVLLHVIQNGWPDSKSNLAPIVQPYFPVRDTLTTHDGLIMKGERVWIPSELRSQMKAHLHLAHLGYDSMIRRARDTIFWLSINREIRQIADNCLACQKRLPSNPKEPLLQHAEGNHPWEKVGIDLCEYQGKAYLVTVDYFSNFFEVDVMTSTTAKQMITCLKRHFARYGIPKCIVSDFGPQMMSNEFRDKVVRDKVVVTVRDKVVYHSRDVFPWSSLSKWKGRIRSQTFQKYA